MEVETYLTTSPGSLGLFPYKKAHDEWGISGANDFLIHSFYESKTKNPEYDGKYEVGKDFFKDFCIMNMGSSLE